MLRLSTVGEGEVVVIGLYIMLGGMLFFAGLITTLDWYSRHRERTARRK
jgi:hypothetical protein